MRMRSLRWVGLIAGGAILAGLVCIGAWIVVTDAAFERSNITNALLRDARYDPAEHFNFDRACTVPPESGFPVDHAYRDVDLIYLPDTFTHWSLVLIDDEKKTYRILCVVDGMVKSPGIVCSRKITLRTEMVDGQVAAYVEESRGH